jgi:hypothetical protein
MWQPRSVGSKVAEPACKGPRDAGLPTIRARCCAARETLPRDGRRDAEHRGEAFAARQRAVLEGERLSDEMNDQLARTSIDAGELA